MSMTPQAFLLLIFISACVTYFLRAVSFLVFRGDRKMPKSLDKLGKILPNAVMAVLVVYCLKDVPEDFSHIGIPKLIAVLLVAISYKWKHSTFLSILIGTVAYMILLVFFK